MTSGDESTRALARGGPMDGTPLGDDVHPVYEVSTADGARWRYLRTDEIKPDFDGAQARVYQCAGRF